MSGKTVNWQLDELSSLNPPFTPVHHPSGIIELYPSMAGNPVVGESIGGCYLNIFYRGYDNHIHQLYFTTDGWNYSDLTASTGAPDIAGDPSYYKHADETTHVIYRGSDNTIHELWNANKKWHLNNLGGSPMPDSTGDPYGYSTAYDNTQHIVYRDTNSCVREIRNSGGSWVETNLTTTLGGHLITVGKVKGFVREANKDHHVIFHCLMGAALGGIGEYYYNGKWNWNSYELTSLTGAPSTAGDPCGYNWDRYSSMHICYRGIDNHIHELYFKDNWIHYDLTAASNAGDAISDPACYVSDISDTQNIIYVGLDSHIHQLTYQTEWTHLDLSNQTGAGNANRKGSPSVAVWSVDDTPRIAYWGPEDNLCSLYVSSNLQQMPKWFATGTDNQGQPMRRVTENNSVQYLIRGTETFQTMFKVMRTATKPGHFIYLLGWWLDYEFNLTNAWEDPDIISSSSGSELINLRQKGYGSSLSLEFGSASKSGVMLRAMIWDNTFSKLTTVVNVKDAVSAINQLTTGAAILDNRTLPFGAHHQKILIVNGEDGLTAFCGGVDLAKDRIVPATAFAGFDLPRRGTPMHDVHCMVKGPAAYDLLKIFQQRWNDHPDHVALDKKKGSPIMVPEPQSVDQGRQMVQVGRTYPNGLGSSFLVGRAGEQSAKQMILQAIDQSQSFIYLEDQYLVSLEIRDALMKALSKLQNLTILIPSTEISDLPQCGARRRAFVKPLRDSYPGKVRVFQPKVLPSPSFTPFGYVHSKLWVFDDEYAIIGSANCCRRGYTHDSEVVAGIYDTQSGATLPFAQRLRMKLWSIHLGKPEAQLQDGLSSANLWLSASGFERFDETKYNIDVSGAEVDWNVIYDPDGS